MKNDMCDSKELIVEYLYDDMDRGDRAAFERHLQACADCQGEVSALGGTRTLIASWAPPEPDLGFQMLRRQAAPPPSWRALPVWALAAAAALVLAASAAIANIEVRYGSDGVTVRTGWARAAETAGAGGASGFQTASVPVPSPASGDDFAVIHKRLNELELALAQAPTPLPAAQPASAGGLTDAELLRRVRQVVSEAETRQQREFALQMAQMFRDFDRQRRTDLAAIQEGLQGYQGLTNAELAKNRDMVNQLFRVSTRQER